MLSKYFSQFERMKRLILKNVILFQIVLLILISSSIYLPKVGQLQYFKDDWYYVLDGLYGGPTLFNEMFAIDRPARGLLFQTYFSLFSANPLPYHLGHYFWRVSAAITALWMFRMLWPRQARQAFFAALFFLIYPGYLWWTSGIEYQPMVMSLFLQVLSIALTVKAILSPKLLNKVIFVLGSTISGWGYLSLVDYAIGMEFFRLGLIFVLVNRGENISLLKKGFQAIRVWFFTSFIIPGSFLFWNTFIFTSARKATDLGTQLVPFLDAPRQVLKLWLVGVIRDGLTVSFLAWTEPFSQFFWSLSLNEIIVGLIFAVLLAGFVYAVCHIFGMPSEHNGKFEPLVLGFVSCFVGVIPIVIANRYVDFGFYSHYSLPVSLTAALFFASLVAFISPRKMQLMFVSLVVAASALSHYAVATSVIREIDIINSFWWQTYWRAPGIRADTTLIVDYPVFGFDDQTDNIWGPANLLYYPDEKQPDIPVQYHLAALPLVGPEFENAFSKGEQKTGYRTHYFRYNVEEILVLSQPVDGACVRIIDGNIPVLSSSETSQIKMVAPYSKIENVILDSPSVVPSPVFGKEPERDWCYFFEKLELAIQRGEKDTALSLANEAFDLNLSPRDPVEWMPFLYTYMLDDDLEMVTTIGGKIKKDEFLEEQTCNVFLEYRDWETQLSQEMNDTVNFLFCPE